MLCAVVRLNNPPLPTVSGGIDRLVKRGRFIES